MKLEKPLHKKVKKTVTKTTISAFVGLSIVGTFLILSYINNHLFMDKLLVASFILLCILGLKILNESNFK
ncbi:hypothetical protein J8281_17575 [Aquimarina sp. U1-2]|uniref:hypothetical protein n=1 Tax=Aquimarina sp. U1-2 TaxID=2823141 RepID=UPI001AECEA2C|nr:hypothetical protein [Aquimarina sp. U1-2]MBP2834010.1 hypothetical protein [Aquimarina sp. U1-2]